jgi:serine/threonine protein phosphatase 1
MPNEPGRLIAFGDVHGCVHALDTLLDAIAPRADDRLVFLGDVIDQGCDSCEVIERMIELSGRCRLVFIQGNHEEMMCAARTSIKALRYWEDCGGVATLNSYRFGAEISAIPAEHWQFIGRAVPYFETDDFIFTHANYEPGLPMNLQPEHQLRWASLDPQHVHPHMSGKTVIVGHTEQPDSEILDLGFVVAIDTACWRYGWLTALEVRTRQVWQASRWGLLRESGESTHRGRLALDHAG